MLFVAGAHSRGSSRKRRPIGEKESGRWITGFDRAIEVAAELRETRLVHLSDSESDVYELLERASGGEVDWILRAGQNRGLVPEEEPLLDESGEPVADRLREVVATYRLRPTGQGKCVGQRGREPPVRRVPITQPRRGDGHVESLAPPGLHSLIL